jgi:hypothetical protein
MLLKDKNLQQSFDNYFHTFRTKGWQQFIENAEENLRAIENLDNIKNLEELFKVKGARDVLRSIIGFQVTMESQYDELYKQQEAEDTEEEDDIYA